MAANGPAQCFHRLRARLYQHLDGRYGCEFGNLASSRKANGTNDAGRVAQIHPARPEVLRNGKQSRHCRVGCNALLVTTKGML